ncbi:MAG: [FeFe] hydrogenase H-cluster radical SAM maturase HydE [Lachnospiraceae bacterium]|nr:[FeFe] hydrogenase H-cluster radical SAM maturase HydE [Lachnospiraceae bacterium]
MDYQGLIDKYEKERDLDDAEFEALLSNEDDFPSEYLDFKARKARERAYGKGVYLRGLIEFTNHCRNNCYYCGIRCGNKKVKRYRLSEEQILSISESGYRKGLRTFVLQGGEDAFFTDDRLVSIIAKVREACPDAAITLSIGERSRKSYERLYGAGANRFLLRHETADRAHYEALHPKEMSYEHRMDCLKDLKKIGYQVGCGMMVGSPGQSSRELIRDLHFIRDFKPHMVGIGPFIPHHDTPFASCPSGSVDMTLRLLAIIRLLLPKVLLPATTALRTLDPKGYEKGLLAGANVIMINLTPPEARIKYSLYDGKGLSQMVPKEMEGDEVGLLLDEIKKKVQSTGYIVSLERGDYKNS